MTITKPEIEQRYYTEDRLMLVNVPTEFISEILDPLLKMSDHSRAIAAKEILTKKTLSGKLISTKALDSIYFFGQSIPYAGDKCLWLYLRACTPSEARGLFLFECTIESRDYFKEEDKVQISYGGWTRTLPHSYTHRLGWFNNTYFRERAIKEFFKDSLSMANSKAHDYLYMGSGPKGSDFYFKNIGVEHKFVSGPISSIKHKHDASYIIGYLSLADKFVMIDATGNVPRWMRDEVTKKEDFPLNDLTSHYKKNYAQWIV